MAGAQKLAISVRHRQIAELVGQAKTNQEIAHALGLTEGTVKEYVSAIFRRLKVTNRTELAVLLWKSHPKKRNAT